MLRNGQTSIRVENRSKSTVLGYFGLILGSESSKAKSVSYFGVSAIVAWLSERHYSLA
jgi:hypothetical protein